MLEALTNRLFYCLDILARQHIAFLLTVLSRYLYSNINPANAAQHIIRIGLMRINAMPMKLAMSINIFTQKYHGLMSKDEKFSLLNNPKDTAASINPTTAGRNPLIMLSMTGDFT